MCACMCVYVCVCVYVYGLAHKRIQSHGRALVWRKTEARCAAVPDRGDGAGSDGIPHRDVLAQVCFGQTHR